MELYLEYFIENILNWFYKGLKISRAMTMNELTQLKSNLVEACYKCIQDCTECANTCQKMLGMENCVKQCGRCVDACKDCISAFERQSENRGLLLQSCIDACKSCIEECSKHQHEHCQKCVDSCRSCIMECEELML